MTRDELIKKYNDACLEVEYTVLFGSKKDIKRLEKRIKKLRKFRRVLSEIQLEMNKMIQKINKIEEKEQWEKLVQKHGQKTC